MGSFASWYVDVHAPVTSLADDSDARAFSQWCWPGRC